MDVALALTLAGLALVDSTSFGTLLIPVWLMLTPGGIRPARLLLFLGVVAGFYLAVGAALLLGGAALVEAAGDGVGDSEALAWVQLAIGVALFAASFRVGRGGSGRLTRWRTRATEGEGSVRGLVLLALVAATLEVATMLPYLGAIGLLAGSGLETPAQVGVLAGYCVVMVVPALVLLAVRLLLAARVEPALGRVAGWLERTGAEATAWVLGIAGFLVARDAVVRLGPVRDLLGL